MRLNEIDTDKRSPWMSPVRLVGLALVVSLGLTGPALAEEGGLVQDDAAVTEEQASACGDRLRQILERPERDGSTRTDLSEGDQVVILIEGPRGGQVIMGCTADGERFHGHRFPDQDSGELESWKIGVPEGVTAESLPNYDEFDFPGDGELREMTPRPAGPSACGERPPRFRRPPRPGAFGQRPGRMRIPRMRPGQECPEVEDFGDPDTE